MTRFDLPLILVSPILLPVSEDKEPGSMLDFHRRSHPFSTMPIKIATRLTPLGLAACLGLTAGIWGLEGAIAPQIAQAYIVRVTISLDSQEGEVFEVIRRRAEAAARAAVQRSFDQDILASAASVRINIERNGLVLPLLTVDVSRTQWKNRPDPQRWATYYRSARTLLRLDEPVATPATPAPATAPATRPVNQPRSRPVPGQTTPPAGNTAPNAPGTAAPSTVAPAGTTAPGTTAPGVAPNTTAPGTAAPAGTTAPGTTTPNTTAPNTTAPNTTTPGTTTPDTTAPATTTPGKAGTTPAGQTGTPQTGTPSPTTPTQPAGQTTTPTTPNAPTDPTGTVTPAGTTVPSKTTPTTP